jgi:hypothetical protein
MTRRIKTRSRKIRFWAPRVAGSVHARPLVGVCKNSKRPRPIFIVGVAGRSGRDPQENFHVDVFPRGHRHVSSSPAPRGAT